MNLAFIPSPSISSFNIGSVTIRFYALAILIGLCVAVAGPLCVGKSWGGSFDQISDVTLVTVPSRNYWHVFILMFLPPLNCVLVKWQSGRYSAFGMAVLGHLGAVVLDPCCMGMVPLQEILLWHY